MSEGFFLHPERVHLIWLAIAFVVVIGLFEIRGLKSVKRLLSEVMGKRLIQSAARWRSVVRFCLMLTCLLVGILAMMRPQSARPDESVWAREAAAEIMVVLDVSRSMLAEDAAPNRLARAKAELRDLARALPGHRMGLIAFAGRAVILSPMTADRSFFRLVLSEVDTDTVTRGGTRIGDALLKAVESFNPGPGAKLIVLITDGEDHDSFPLDAAKEARDQGIHIISIGFGSEKGSPIEVTDPLSGERKPLVDRDGRTVLSRLDGDLLRELALKTDGIYVPAGVGVLDLESIVEFHIAPLIKEAGMVTTRMVRTERYPIWVMTAFVSLILAVWVGSGGSRRSRVEG